MLLFPALLRAQGEPAPSDVPETPQNAGAGEWRGKGAIAIREVPCLLYTSDAADD